ncbi:GNAT family N-acetyltransferase [Bowdeniella massiliensis]|uniref:GNAT family N-acetyltransferase n=1 Tax=Bowdeniella massiliensis TaxID=2932264 RepID=UPI003D6CC18A
MRLHQPGSHLESDLVLWKLYVLPEFQRAGVGQRLMEATPGEAWTPSGCDTANSPRRNSQALVYSASGFAQLRPAKY